MNIYILYTGGTIGCVGNPLSPMSGDTFRHAFNTHITPTILQQYPAAKITISSFSSTLDSTNMQPAEWVRMARQIADNYNEYDAFLVLHGTDTMAWTASALSFMLPGVSKTVIVTGSQLPLFAERGIHRRAERAGKYCDVLYNSDAVRNVLGAISFFPMRVPEVCLYFADALFRGNRAVKSNSADFLAFSSPNYHKLGTYGVSPTLHREYVRSVPGNATSMSIPENLRAVRANIDVIERNIGLTSVLQLQTFPGHYSHDGKASLLASMMQLLRGVSPPLAGVVFESYGNGNIPSYTSMREVLKALHDEDGVVLIDCTQVFAGAVNYNEYATGVWLNEAGVVSGYDMTPSAAMAKLTVLKAGRPLASMRELEMLMETDMAGEMESGFAMKGRKDFEEDRECDESVFSLDRILDVANTSSGSSLIRLGQNPKILKFS